MFSDMNVAAGKCAIINIFFDLENNMRLLKLWATDLRDVDVPNTTTPTLW